MHRHDTPRLALAFAAAILACCAPREAGYPVSERARAAPQPDLAPTARFDAPIAGGFEAAARLGEETRSLAARAAALRARGAALAGTGFDAEAESPDTP